MTFFDHTILIHCHMIQCCCHHYYQCTKCVSCCSFYKLKDYSFNSNFFSPFTRRWRERTVVFWRLRPHWSRTSASRRTLWASTPSSVWACASLYQWRVSFHQCSAWCLPTDPSDIISPTNALVKAIIQKSKFYYAWTLSIIKTILKC